MSVTRVNTHTINNAHVIDEVRYNFGGNFSNEIINKTRESSEYKRNVDARLHLQHFFIFVGFIIFLTYIIILIRGRI